MAEATRVIKLTHLMVMRLRFEAKVSMMGYYIVEPIEAELDAVGQTLVSPTRSSTITLS